MLVKCHRIVILVRTSWRSRPSRRYRPVSLWHSLTAGGGKYAEQRNRATRSVVLDRADDLARNGRSGRTMVLDGGRQSDVSACRCRSTRSDRNRGASVALALEREQAAARRLRRLRRARGCP